MNFKEIIIYIFVPILSSIIGGICTFIGVLLTIKHENKKHSDEKILANKPLFYRLDTLQEYDYKSAVDFYLDSGDNAEKKNQIYGVIKNTDNAILIIKEMIIDGEIYKSLYGNVVDKNQVFNLYVNVLCDVTKIDEIILLVQDIFENTYNYKLEINCKDNKYGEISSIKEIK